MKKSIVLICLLALLCALFSYAAAEDVTTITASPDTLYVSLGKTGSVKVSVAPQAARRAGVTYASSDESVATVSQRGEVKGVAVGTCHITVTSKHDESVSVAVAVNVVIPVRKVAVATDNNVIHIGETTRITATLTPEDATVQSVVFSSDKEAIATVDANGVVTGISRGTAKINVVSADGKAKTSLNIKVVQKAESVTLSKEALSLIVGRSSQLRASVAPQSTANKKVTWSSSDESIATVNQNGNVTARGPGVATITATSNDDPTVSGSALVTCVRLAKSAAFEQKNYSVIIGQTAPTSVIIGPEDVSSKAVTYKVGNSKIASIDENGVVTGLKGGKTTIYVTTADGSRKQGKATLLVIVPVEGVTYKTPGLRVGSRSTGTFTATILPKDATDTTMTWVISDESIATVSGKNNRFKVKGRQWGRCTVTGTTQDGGHQITLNVNVGSLRHAVTVRAASVRNGRPRVTLQNRSNMRITYITYSIRGYDENGTPVPMSTRGDIYTLNGSYDHPLEPGERTTHGAFNFFHRSNYDGLASMEVAVTGWETDTGYYDDNDVLCTEYRISSGRREWVTGNKE